MPFLTIDSCLSSFLVLCCFPLLLKSISFWLSDSKVYIFPLALSYASVVGSHASGKAEEGVKIDRGP